MNIGVFHPGTQHSWQTALALQQADRLAWYATSLFYKPDEWPYRIERYLSGKLRKRVSAEFGRLAMPALNPELVQASGAAEWFERIANRLGQRELAKWLDRRGNRNFVHGISELVRAPGDLALWGYNGSSLTSFELAKQVGGRPCILDRTIGDARAYNAAMVDLQDRFGEWFLPVERAVPEDTIARDDREFELADHILVGCEYARRTLIDHSPVVSVASKTQVLGYCFDEALFSDIPAPKPVKKNRPVRFLFLGLVIPRKGIHHILEALGQIPESEAELTIVGDMKVPAEAFAKYAGRVTYKPTVARSQVPKIMAEHDVLLLPTYHEGAGIVLYEALAAGMGIIQSNRAALVATPETGLILDQLDTNTVLQALRVPIEDRDRLNGWRAAAQSEAANYTFAKYRQGIETFLAKAGI
ncbi:glycosyltransferase family 4 protein [Altererythrobacter sp. ZODW24]|uniref:glycosyltransferase family 4 protein n=1 Tax=Altererythrobacter sp. ZODW24 TaxID=2185142 RepID=UPI000DF78B97|nr:glycosyltransferase family 4 protein [Altererythrobacter sp. ZODW24]